MTSKDGDTPRVRLQVKQEQNEINSQKFLKNCHILRSTKLLPLDSSSFALFFVRICFLLLPRSFTCTKTLEHFGSEKRAETFEHVMFH